MQYKCRLLPDQNNKRLQQEFLGAIAGVYDLLCITCSESVSPLFLKKKPPTTVAETNCPALSSFSILFQLFRAENNQNPCVLNYHIQLWNAEKLPEDNNSLGTVLFYVSWVIFLTGVSDCAKQSLNSAEVCLLPDNRAHGFPLGFFVFCFLLLKKDKLMHLTTILYTSFRDHSLFFPSVKSALWLNGGTEAKPSVDRKSETAFANGPSWGTVLQKTQWFPGSLKHTFMTGLWRDEGF